MNLVNHMNSLRRCEMNASIEGQPSLLDNMKIIAQSSLQTSPGEKNFLNIASRPKSSAPAANYCRSRKNTQSISRYSI